MSVELTAAELRKLLRYDAGTGVFTWASTRNGCRAGGVAGANHGRGYRQISVMNRLYLAHRLAWLHVHGEWPPQLIDHIDGDRANNTIGNLRLATKAENCRNSRPRRGAVGGLKGTYFDTRRSRWVAQITVDGAHRQLGRFHTAEEAHAAYVEAASELYGQFLRTA